MSKFSVEYQTLQMRFKVAQNDARLLPVGGNYDVVIEEIQDIQNEITNHLQTEKSDWKKGLWEELLDEATTFIQKIKDGESLEPPEEDPDLDLLFNDFRREDWMRVLDEAEDRLRRIDERRPGYDRFNALEEQENRDNAKAKLKELDLEDALESLKYWEKVKTKNEYQEELKAYNIRSAKKTICSLSGNNFDNELNALISKYEEVIQVQKLCKKDKRGLEALVLKARGHTAKEIFSSLRPDDSVKDPAGTVRGYYREGRDAAQGLGLPPLPSE